MGKFVLHQRLLVALFCLCCCMLMLYFTCPREFQLSVQQDKSYEVSIEKIDLSTNGEVNRSEASIMYIDKAHREGIPHRGVWMIYLRPASAFPGKYEILMVRRSLQAKTCPGAWSLPGEHTKFKESYRTTALRGSLEEFDVTESAMECVVPLGCGWGKEVPDRSRPVLYRIEYPGPSHRVDVQWVVPYLLIMKMNISFKLEAESSVMQWVLVENALQWAARCKLNRDRGSGNHNHKSNDNDNDNDSHGHSHSHSHSLRNSDRYSITARSKDQHAMTSSDTDLLDSDPEHCHPCQVNYFSIYNPEHDTTVQTSFLEVITHMIEDVQQFVNLAQNRISGSSTQACL